MQTLRGYDNWRTTPPEPRNPMCTCGHKWEEHTEPLEEDDGWLAKGNYRCDFWIDCDCEEFIQAEGGDE